MVMISAVTQELVKTLENILLPPKIFFSILLYGLHQRTCENIKPDGQKRCV